MPMMPTFGRRVWNYLSRGFVWTRTDEAAAIEGETKQEEEEPIQINRRLRSKPIAAPGREILVDTEETNALVSSVVVNGSTSSEESMTYAFKDLSIKQRPWFSNVIKRNLDAYSKDRRNQSEAIAIPGRAVETEEWGVYGGIIWEGNSYVRKERILTPRPWFSNVINRNFDG